MSTVNLGSMFQSSTPGLGKARKTAPSTRFTSRIEVVTMPNEAPPDARDGYALYMMLCGTSLDQDVDQWKTYVAAYSAFMVPALASVYPRALYNVVQMSDAKVATIATAYRGFVDALVQSGAEATGTQKQAFLTATTMLGYPTPDTTKPWHEGVMEVVPKIITSHYSIVLFLMVKRIEGTNHAPIAVARPKALRGKAHINEVCAFLDGSLRLSDSSHLLINNAWSESAALRAACVMEFAAYEESETDITQDLIFTSMHLMRFGHMAHAKISYAFLKAHPWADEVPALQGAIGIYRDSIVSAGKYPEHIRPYVKLIYGDKVGVFPRNELDVLVDCAVAVEKQSNPTLEEFHVSDKYGAVVEAFLQEKENREAIYRLGLQNQLAKLSLEEEFEEVVGDEDAN